MPRKHSCVPFASRLGYCNSLLAGSPKYLLRKLQKIQNSAARVIFRSSKLDHVSPRLHALHWLPVHQRINHKLSAICFSFVTGTGPQYLADIFKIYAPSRQFCSSSDTCLFQIPSVNTKSNGQRTFAYQGPTVWNKLSRNIRHAPSLDLVALMWSFVVDWA